MAMRVLVLVVVKIYIREILVVFFQPLPSSRRNLVFFRFVKVRTRRSGTCGSLFTGSAITATTTTASTTAAATAGVIGPFGILAPRPSRTLGEVRRCRIV